VALIILATISKHLMWPTWQRASRLALIISLTQLGRQTHLVLRQLSERATLVATATSSMLLLKSTWVMVVSLSDGTSITKYQQQPQASLLFNTLLQPQVRLLSRELPAQRQLEILVQAAVERLESRLPPTIRKPTVLVAEHYSIVIFLQLWMQAHFKRVFLSVTTMTVVLP